MKFVLQIMENMMMQQPSRIIFVNFELKSVSELKNLGFEGEVSPYKLKSVFYETNNRDQAKE